MVETGMNHVLARAAQVKLMIFDVDGVLTDGSLYFGVQGEELKRFNVLDGQGIKMLQLAGIESAIISARQSEIVVKRASELGLRHLQQGVPDKVAAFERLMAQLELDVGACGYVGDDVIDLPILARVGFAASVANGHSEVRARVHYVTQASGGNGAVRELCDFVLRAQAKYETAIARYLSRPT